MLETGPAVDQPVTRVNATLLTTPTITNRHTTTLSGRSNYTSDKFAHK